MNETTVEFSTKRIYANEVIKFYLTTTQISL